MTQPRDLDHLLTAFFAAGTDELADRVIDAALVQIDHSPQRHALRLPRRFTAMTMTTRLAAAAVIGVLAVGGAFYLLKPSDPSVGSPTPTPAVSVLPSAAARTPVPTTKPDPAALTGPLGDGRQIHTATTLADGRVLVAGGYDFEDQPLGSAVVFAPASGAFTRTGSMAAARGEQTATLLPDGRVLMAGGGIAAWVFQGAFLASAELYDATTGTFGPTGSMATPRQGHTATPLAGGRILIAGGADTNSHSLASAELYDPTTGTFSATGSMVAARAWHTATLLADGRVLVVGGMPNSLSANVMLTSAEIYDPKTGRFSATGQMVTGRAFPTATTLADGRVLITGGASSFSDDLASAEIFDPGTGTFTETNSMAVGRQYHTATLLANGRVLIAGGGGDYTNRQFIASAELFDPTTGTFTATGPMTGPRTNHMATVLPDGRVLLTGGYGDLAPLASAEIYDPVAGTFLPAG